MIIHPGFVGIDISKDRLDVFDAATGRSEPLPNEAQAIASLVERLRACGTKLVVFEATGRYDAPLRMALAAAGLSSARVNPARAIRSGLAGRPGAGFMRA
jgi:transposase